MAIKNNLLFDYLKNILELKSYEKYEKDILNPEFNSSFSKFMILRYLSMHKKSDVRCIILNNQLFLERFTDNEILYKYLLDNIPKQTNSFIQYIK
jgi:hypothetical protein